MRSRSQPPAAMVSSQFERQGFTERRMQRRREQWVVAPPPLPQPPPPTPSQQKQVGSLRNSGNASRAPLAGGLTCPPHDPALREPPPSPGAKWTALCAAAPEYSAVGAEGISASAPQKHQRKTDNRMCTNQCLLREHLLRTQCLEAGALAPEHAVFRRGEGRGVFWN